MSGWTELRVIAVFRQEPSDGVDGCTILETLGGPKRYARIWDGLIGPMEWGWRLHESAVKVWPREER